MEIKLDSKLLHESLKSLMKAVPSKSSLPILDNFLFRIVKSNEGELIEITSFDLETLISVQLPTLSVVGPTCEMAIPAKLFTQLFATLPQGEVTLTHDPSENTVKCSWESGKSIFPTFNPEDFPRPSEIDENCKEVTFTRDFLRRALNKTIIAVSTATDGKIIEGVHFSIDKNGSTVVGTNSHILVCVDSDVTGDCSFTIPLKAANVLKSMLEKGGDVKITCDSKNAVFEFGNSRIVTRLLSGKFPGFKKVIPQNNPHVMTVKKNEIEAVLKRINVCTNSVSKLISMKLSFNEVEISGQDLGFQIEASEVMPIEYDGDDLTVGFKATALIDLLANIESENIEIKFLTSKHATLIKPVEEEYKNETVLSVIMPLAVS